MKTLKVHWGSMLPGVSALNEAVDALPSSNSFDAGVIPDTGQRVYLWFQTTGKEAGLFTINLVVVDEGCEVNTSHIARDRWPAERLGHGSHRIGRFIGNGRHDKWWHLCEVQIGSVGVDPEFMLELRLELRKGNWTAASYEEEERVISGAVEDVTREVEAALKAIGIRAI